MEFAFIDLQGFKHKNNEFVVKEICILTKNIKFHEIIKPPYQYNCLTEKYKREARWLTNTYHGIYWQDGCITQHELKKLIQPIINEKILLVKGNEKVKWLKEIFGDKYITCINMDNIGCTIKLSKFSTTDVNRTICDKHNNLKQYHCSFQNALLLKEWYNKNKIKNKLYQY